MKKSKKFYSKILLFTLLLSIISVTAAACAPSTLYTEGDGDLNVVCTSFAPFDLARQVGGDRVTLTVLQDNGADLHNYSPTAKTLAALNEADIFICIGGESEGTWTEDAVSSAQNPELKIIRLTDGIELKHAALESHTHEDGEHAEEEGDEHVWLSVKNAIKITESIRAAFAERDAKNADYYMAQADACKVKLTALDGEYEKAVSEAKTKTVAFADRFPFIYLVEDYGLSYYAAFSGCSTEVNADFATQIKLINAVKNHTLPAVIVTEGGNKELADNICAETGCKKVVLNSMQSITRAEIESGATYIGIMTENLAALTAALG